MKNLIVVLSIALLSVSMNVNAQEKPVAKKGCCASKVASGNEAKKACATATTADADTKTASATTTTTTEIKSCDKQKKAGCCAKKA